MTDTEKLEALRKLLYNHTGDTQTIDLLDQIADPDANPVTASMQCRVATRRLSEFVDIIKD